MTVIAGVWVSSGGWVAELEELEDEAEAEVGDFDGLAGFDECAEITGRAFLFAGARGAGEAGEEAFAGLLEVLKDGFGEVSVAGAGDGLEDRPGECVF